MKAMKWFRVRAWIAVAVVSLLAFTFPASAVSQGQADETKVYIVQRGFGNYFWCGKTISKPFLAVKTSFGATTDSKNLAFASKIA